MVDIFNAYKFIALNPSSATNGATITSLNIDTAAQAGHDSLVIDLISTTADVVSNSPSVLKLQESDDTVASNFADITAFVGGTAVGTSVGFVIPNGDTATTNAVYATFEVDLKPRKRYLRLVGSPRTTQTWAAIASLGRSRQVPVSVTARNVRVAVTG